jgi:hypothetical protein
MSRSVPERDWRFLRKIEPEMLGVLYARINKQARDLLESPGESERDRYHRLYRHVKDSDRIVGDCFDDWRRSNILFKIPLLRREGLLTDEHLSQMSDEVKDFLERLARLENESGRIAGRGA